MKILALIPPGRFPTVVLDTGLWWDTVTAAEKHNLVRFSANFTWWQAICSYRFKRFALEPLGRIARLRQRAQWRADKLALDYKAAGVALEQFTAPDPFDSSTNYLSTVRPIARFLADVNRAQSDFNVSISAGPRVNDLDYNNSAALLRYSQTDNFLSRSISASLENCTPRLDLILMAVTSPEDLLTTMIAARILRAQNATAHVSLVDHGYENFSLHAKIEGLRQTGTLEQAFDTIIESKDDRDDVVPALVESIARGERPRGVLNRTSLAASSRRSPAPPRPPPISPTFAAEPIFGTRLSNRRCYWSRCTYCTQNSKYDNPRAPTRSEILKSLDRIQACIAAGYRFFYFLDEALSPSTLRILAEEIEARRISMHWACRCKLERAHTPELFERLGRAGCYEILFGLETTSARVLKLMDKYVEGIDELWIANIFRAMNRAGIGIHVNLIGGYPGDTLSDTERSVEFLIREFPHLRGGTYLLNGFAMLADSPVANIPEHFGISKVIVPGDIAQSYEYELMPQIAETTAQVQRELPRLRKVLDSELGWTAIGNDVAAYTAVELYFLSGHGSIFKARPDNPFANPLHTLRQ